MVNIAIDMQNIYYQERVLKSYIVECVFVWVCVYVCVFVYLSNLNKTF